MASRRPPPRLDAWATVSLVDGGCHHGVLYAADPESGHVVLLQPHTPEEGSADEDSRPSVKPLVIFGPSIATVYQDSVAPTDDSVLHLERVRTGVAPRLSSDRTDLHAVAPSNDERRLALRGLLLAHHVPFEECEGGSFVVLGCLRIEPPYTAQACCCDNEVVLDRFSEMARAAHLSFLDF